MHFNNMLLYNLLSLVVLFVYALAVPRQEDNTVITQIECGAVRGYIRDGDSCKYVSYRGIPYAEPPVGELRYQPLRPSQPWSEVHDAKDEGPICLQPSVLFDKITRPRGMSEDCIFANIHAPLGTSKDNLKPVFVFIHGGGFSYGAGDSDMYGPEFLVERECLVVTFNYRLGAIGFLSLNTPEVPGNLGLKDQLFFLEWLNRNIECFGGDPDNIVLAGQGAGGVAAHLMSLSQQSRSRGLFHRLILQSGNALSSFAALGKPYAREMAKQFTTLLDINSTDPTTIYKCLLDTDARSIVEASQKLIDKYGIVTFGPVIEDIFPGVTPFITEFVPDAYFNKEFDQIPALIGFTSNEGPAFYERLKKIHFLDALKQNSELALPAKVFNLVTEKSLPETLKLILSKYFPDGFSLINYLKLVTDSAFISPVVLSGRYNYYFNRANVYLYEFAAVTELNLFKRLVSGSKFKGTVHYDDLFYIFKCNACNYTITPGSVEEAARDYGVSIYTDFIKTGNPTPATNDWKPTNVNLAYARITETNLTMCDNPYPSIVKLWDTVYTYLFRGVLPDHSSNKCDC